MEGQLSLWTLIQPAPLERRNYFDSDNATAVYGALPLGVVPNFVDPVDKSEQIVVANVLGIVICTLLVIGRVYSKIFVTKNLGWDDYACVAGFVFAVFYGGCILAMAAHGLGRHEWDIPHSWLRGYLFWNWMNNFYWISAAASKSSVLLFYIRIFHHNRVFSWAAKGMLVFVNLMCFVSLFAVLFNCNPVRSNWSATWKSKCYSTDNIIYAATALNIFQDLAILIMPIPLIRTLQIPNRQRLMVMSIFLSGTLATVVSAIRMVELARASGEDLDYSWAYFGFYLWTIIEVYVFVMVACLPIMKALARKFAPKLFDSTNRATGGRSGSTSSQARLTDKFPNFRYSESMGKSETDGSLRSLSNASESIYQPEKAHVASVSERQYSRAATWTASQVPPSPPPKPTGFITSAL